LHWIAQGAAAQQQMMMMMIVTVNHSLIVRLSVTHSHIPRGRQLESAAFFYAEMPSAEAKATRLIGHQLSSLERGGLL